uniref:T9SS type A sorting domain-containing protein n=1 Tax=candidate division WOR-3 bacterium TaxID=2052148 RepID=A0A7C4TCL6_UNCW3
MANMLIFLALVSHSNVLSIEPARIPPLAIGDSFWVTIKISDCIPIYGYSGAIYYDPTVLEYRGIKRGPFMRRFQSTALWIAPQSVGPGYVADFGEALYNPSRAAFGSGVLDTIKFKVIGSGSSPLQLNLKINDTLKFDWDLSTRGGSTVEPLAFVNGWYGSQSLEIRPTFNITPGVANAQELPSATWFTPVSRYVVVWQDRRNGYYDIYGQQVNTDGTLYNSNYVICDSTGDQLEPAIAYNPTGGLFTYALVVWADYRRGLDSADIYGRLLYRGSPVSAADFPIARYPNCQINPQIASLGGKYLVVWEDIPVDTTNLYFSYICGQLLNYNGTVVGDTFMISGNYDGYYYNYSPTIAASDSAFFVVWNRKSVTSGASQVFGRVIDTLGNLGSERTIVSGYSNFAFSASCAYSNTDNNFLVIWTGAGQTGNNTFEYLTKIKGIIYSKSGYPISSPFLIYEKNNNADSKFLDSIIQSAEVHFDGANYLVVWHEKYGPGIDSLRGCFVSPTGNVGDPFGLIGAPYSQAFPSGTKGSGNNSILVWQDFRNGTDYDIWGYLGPPIGIEETTSPKSEIGNPKLEVYPNPFREKMIIRYTIQDAGYKIQDMGLKIYDITGRLVKSFNLSTRYSLLAPPIEWDGTDDSGIPVESGVYFAKFGSETVKVLFLK